MSKKKIRVELRKNRTKPPRGNDLTRQFHSDASGAEDAAGTGERVRAKGDVSRHRTIVTEGPDDALAIDTTVCQPGRVLRVQGLHSYVELDDGSVIRCAIRRLLKSLSQDERNAVTTGDRVWIRKATDATDTAPLEGIIERVEPRHGILTRSSRRREHILVSNVDQLLIVMSLVEPDLKPHLIDRYVAAAEKGSLTPVICLNKADLVEAAEFQPLIGSFARLGITAFLTSTRTGFGIPSLREILHNRATVFSGQSGVGKTSLLNALQPGLALRVKEISESTQKGKHTTTTAELVRLDFGGWVVDTPGIRQMALWNTQPEEVEGYFREFRPYVAQCGFPDCTHIHETKCAVKKAVSRRMIAERRYISYLGLFQGSDEG